MANATHSNEDANEELPFEENFIEQAEYIRADKFLELAIDHPEEGVIVKKLMGGGAKLLVGPRGCGKSTLMLKAFYTMLNQSDPQSLPVYVNFKLALKLEPFYVKGANAPYWFKKWLILKIFQATNQTFEAAKNITAPDGFPSNRVISKLVSLLEANEADNDKFEVFTLEFLVDFLERAVNENALVRCVLLIDDAAHSFSEKQQQDFFDFFRALKSRLISPKAAIYPGVTSHSPSFHVGHDAEQIDAWIKPVGRDYEIFMVSMAEKRFAGTNINVVSRNVDDILFLAYSAFGIPRGFLGMLRAIYNSPAAYITNEGTLSKSKVLQLARSGRDMSHAVYESLPAKMPSYKSYVENGSRIYQALLSKVKTYNSTKEIGSQALQFGIHSPIGADFEKVFGFLQYSGLIMPAGTTLRGIKGSFEIFDLHLGDLVADNIIVGRRTKSSTQFLEAIRSTKHQAWPRLTEAAILESTGIATKDFQLSLPQCHACGAPRSNPEARFCSSCGAQLKPSSTYETLVQRDISVLPLSPRILKRIKENSHMRKVSDILIDSSREQLRGIKYIGEVRARKIVGLAEEYVS